MRSRASGGGQSFLPVNVVWMRVLANVDSIAMRRRDELITALARAD